MKLPLAALLLLNSPLLADPIAGAWEAFPSQANANAWSVIDFAANAAVGLPVWTNSGGGFILKPLHGVPDVSSGVWFFTADEAGNGAVVGNYLEKKIRGLRVRHFVDPAELREMDCVIYATGPAGSTFYYSESILGADMTGGAMWRTAEFLFNQSWYYVEAGAFKATPVTTQMLSSIGEIGFRFIPKNGMTTTTSACIDDVVLIPTVELPVVTTGVAGSNFTLSFTPGPGTGCSVMKSQTGDLANWQGVAGQQNLGGTSARVFQTPMSEAKAFFEVQVAEYLTPVITP